MRLEHLKIVLLSFIYLLVSVNAWGEANVVLVSKDYGEFKNPVDAMNSITDASRSNPYIISVAPGVYNLRSIPLYMKSHVSLVGSGQKATYIVGRVDSAAMLPDGGPGLINGADASEIRHLTVINRYDGTAHAIHNFDASPLISHVTAIARGGGGSGAFKAGLWDDAGSASTLEHVTLRALGESGGSPCLGLFNRNSVTRVHGSRLIANGCLINNGVTVDEGGRVLIDDTTIVAKNSPSGLDNAVAVTTTSIEQARATIRNTVIRGSIIADNVDPARAAGMAIVRIATSMVDGTISSGTWGEIKCVGAFDAYFDPLGVDCLTAP